MNSLKWFFAFFLSVISNSLAASSFNLEFNEDGVLPSISDNRWLYDISSRSYPESSAFTVSNGLLHLDTTKCNYDCTAYYLFAPNDYDRTYPARMVTRARVLSGNGQGITFAFLDNTFMGIITIHRGGWSLYGLPGARGVISTPDVFHEFALSVAPGAGLYQFKIDGHVVSTGTLPKSTYTPGQIYFGDGTPTGGNVLAEVDYIRYTNNADAFGELGPKGDKGDKGDNGVTGLQGLPGKDGAAGKDGAQGLPGKDGAQGLPGKDGAQGLPGKNGAQGLPGKDGAQGLPGKDGAQGLPGKDGAQGLPGKNGAQGLPGKDGAQGLPGKDGAQGLPGKDGAQGLPGKDGAQGLPGKDGAQGLPGKDGAQGLPGKDGAQGLPGKDAKIPPTCVGDRKALQFDGNNWLCNTIIGK